MSEEARSHRGTFTLMLILGALSLGVFVAIRGWSAEGDVEHASSSTLRAESRNGEPVKSRPALEPLSRSEEQTAPGLQERTRASEAQSEANKKKELAEASSDKRAFFKSLGFRQWKIRSPRITLWKDPAVNPGGLQLDDVAEKDFVEMQKALLPPLTEAIEHYMRQANEIGARLINEGRYAVYDPSEPVTRDRTDLFCSYRVSRDGAILLAKVYPEDDPELLETFTDTDAEYQSVVAAMQDFIIERGF